MWLSLFLGLLHLYSHTLMFTCFDDRMLPCLYALMITCHLLVCRHSHMTGCKCFDDCMLTCVDIHMFDIHTRVHTRWLWNIYSLGGISDCVVGCTCAQILWWLCLYAEEIGRLKLCVLECLNANRLVCSHNHILVCSNDQMLVCSYALLMACTFVLALMITFLHALVITCANV